MKTLTKILSAVLAVCMLLTLCACHGKNETALTIEGEEITTALYLNALIDCDSEARRRVDEKLAAEETETTGETDYYSQTIDELSFVEYVETKTIERCKEYIYYDKLVKAGTIKLEEEEISTAEYYASAYWSQYGYAYLYEPNGVSFETYKKAFIYSYYSNKYFNHLYKEGGEKEVPKKDIKDNMLENYALVYVLSSTYEEKATDDQKAAAKKKLEDYEKRLKNGEEFEKIYLEHNGIKEEEHTHEKTEDGPKLQHTSIIADKDLESDYASADFDSVYDLKTGETIIIENEEKTGITLYVKLDIADDDYYLTNLTDSILYEMKNEEFQKFITEKTKDYKVEKNTYATDRLKVENIDYTKLEEYYAAASAAQSY